jgi:hypothetical protein
MTRKFVQSVAFHGITATHPGPSSSICGHMCTHSCIACRFTIVSIKSYICVYALVLSSARSTPVFPSLRLLPTVHIRLTEDCINTF